MLVIDDATWVAAEEKKCICIEIWGNVLKENIEIIPRSCAYNIEDQIFIFFKDRSTNPRPVYGPSSTRINPKYTVYYEKTSSSIY